MYMNVLHYTHIFWHVTSSLSRLSLKLSRAAQRFNICDPWPLITSSGIAPPSLKKSMSRKEPDSRPAMA